MRLLLLAAMAIAIGATTTHAHDTVVSSNPVCKIFRETFSVESLQKNYRHIDLVSVSERKKRSEFFLYKNGTQPFGQNKQISGYFEERLKVVK